MQLNGKSLLLFILLSTPIFLFAQKFDRPNGFGGQVLFIDHASFAEDREGGFNNMTTGFEFSYSRHLNRFISVRVPFKGGIANTGESEFARNRSFFGVDMTVQASYFGNESPVAPFVYAGYGGTKEEGQDTYFQVPFGGGLNVRIGQWGFFQVKAEYRTDLANDLPRQNMQYGLGLVAVVGPTQTTKEIEKMLSDSDGDGIDDEYDRCPNIPGRKQFGGCLDSDNDGIGDADDSCPDEVGLAALNGCPDSDADGIADVVDDCPNIPGTADGCPDADKDGIADAKDKCPDLPGQAGFDGCPEDPTEVTEVTEVAEATEMTEATEAIEEPGATDKDIVLDSGAIFAKDDEMTEKGAEKIMLDSDGDSYADAFDDCPNSPGPANGCPDRDSDGVADHRDTCPDRAGTAYNNGCPERGSVDTYRSSTTYSSNNTSPSSYSSTSSSSVVSKSAISLMENATRTVQFKVLSDDLAGVSFDVLNQVVDLMIANPSYRLKVSGHTDNRGEESVNQRLSEKRARACIRYLRGRGVPELQMSYAGYGARVPIADNDTEYGRSQNRRVDFELFTVN